MERCETCKWWDGGGILKSKKRGGYCDVTFQPQAKGLLEPVPLRTGADFGCVLHSPIPGTHGSGCGPGGDTLRGLRFTITDNPEAKADG